MSARGYLAAVVAGAVCAACAHYPAEPSVAALPGRGASSERFQSEDAECRDSASASTGQSPSEVASNTVAAGAAIGTAVGAAAGAAIGVATGNPAAGVGIGAGSGLLVGSAVGSGLAAEAGSDAQYRYDSAYLACMYDKGHRVPARRGFGPARDPGRIPPPPPGRPPAPPPGVE